MTTYIGELCALLTAVVWAFAVILFKKSWEHTHPIILNYFKNFLAIVLLIPTLFLFKEQIFRDVPANDYLLLLLSGGLGLGIADTLFFKSLNLLGASMSAIVDCLYSPFIISLSIVFLNERLSLIQFIGVFMIVSAILTGMSKKSSGNICKKAKNAVKLYKKSPEKAKTYLTEYTKKNMEEVPKMYVKLRETFIVKYTNDHE